MKVTVGPIVGKVTSESARILIECDKQTDVTAHLIDEAGTSFPAQVHVPKDRPRVLQFRGLPAARTYSLRIEGVELPVPCRVRTLPVDTTALNVGAVSCNFTTQRGDTDLWKSMNDLYVAPGSFDLLLHMGDQVYGDAAFGKALAILGASTKPSKSQVAAIMETYRWLYRWTWAAHVPTRQVLASVPNLMIWDDHEIRDDWGSNTEDGVPGTSSYIVGSLARRVYREYQRQLWDDFDPDAEPADGYEDHLHIFGSIGVWFLDQRGGRSFARSSERPYLGRDQWQRVVARLAGEGLGAVRALIVVTSVPLAYLGDSVTTHGAAAMDDLRDHWSYGSHRKEQVEFLRLLREWRETPAENRELLVVGGDVHVGGHTDIKHGGKRIFRQLIASPITTKPPGFFQYLGLRTLLEAEESLGSNYSFEHHDFTRQRSFGVVLVRVPPAGRPKLDGSLMTR